jgi:riboflavin synthase
MFTGIIECIGTVVSVQKQDANITYGIKSSISSQCKIDQSIAHDGVCLTIVAIENDVHFVTAINETLQKTNLQQWQQGSLVNIERAMLANGRLDGHFVQGHVDSTMLCTQIENKNGSWEYTFQYNKEFAALVIEKGSICINGTSLTCFNLSHTTLKVAIIPYTYEHTSIKQLQVGSIVNVEFDIIGKYLLRKMEVEG